jgi:TolB protein
MLFTMDADGKHVTKLIDQPVFSPAACLAWSPDGKRIAFPLETEDGFELHLVRPDGRELKAITKFGQDKMARSPSWSPNGKRLSILLKDYSEGTKKYQSLWVMDANGDNPKELLNLGCDDLFPVAQWRPK